MGRSVLSFNTALAAPIRTGYEGIGAGVQYHHVDAPPLVARSAFYLNLFRKLFQGEVCLKLYGTPYGLFTKGAKGKIIGSSIKVSLKHKENIDFECIEFS